MADFATYTNSSKSSITIRYEIRTRWLVQTEMREFFTKQSAQHFLDNHLPKDARNIDIWFGESAEETRQKPTYYREPRLSTKWWDANKRPFADRYDVEGER